ncbi:MAG TPA: coproporphyrinogen-III oxidase family protein [Anaeromyxobacter sp.]|nr:coproporphyrinogen-III oxidase family protein [Anaeromyxobacter sp.]
MARPFGVYVHFPYCRHRCPYCDFAVTTEPVPRGRSYARAILRELALRAGAFDGLELRSIYLGGGTPSLWDPAEVAEVIGEIRGRFSAVAVRDLEITLEVNPESSGRAQLRAWRAAGVNRVSVGAQSFDPGVLAKLGRRHGPEEAERAIREAAEEIANVSVDLIHASRRSTPASAATDAARAVAAGAVHVSDYALTVDAEVLAEEVPFARMARAGRLPLPGEEEAAAQGRALRAALRRAGLQRYEISNHARPGRESVHNRLYWESESYLGLGAGAYGCLRGEAGSVRYGNLRDTPAWLAAVEASRLPSAEEDRLDPRAERNERVMLALRTISGAPLGWLAPAASREVEGLLRRRLAVVRAGRLVLTSRGMDLHSAVAERLFE